MNASNTAIERNVRKLRLMVPSALWLPVSAALGMYLCSSSPVVH